MTSPIRPTGSLGDELTNAALVGLATLAVIAVILRAAGSVTAFLTGTPQPDTGFGAGAGVLLHPGAPGAALGAPGQNPVSVNYSLSNGTANGYYDYRAPGGSLLFAAGETTKVVRVELENDTTAEGYESFFFNLSRALESLSITTQPERPNWCWCMVQPALARPRSCCSILRNCSNGKRQPPG